MPASALEIIERHAAQAGGLLPALHELQETFGYLPAALVDSIAQAFNISRAEVHGVISFYPDFRTDPAGTHVLRICRAEACQSMGGEELASHAVRSLGCGFHSTTPDGRFTLEPVYCLGLCAQSPAVTLDDRPYARVTPQRLEHLLKSAVSQHAGQLAETEGQS
ncbi:MAG TPA: formate dehydrogenase subunit gamma [Burkholderiaceae bacterium]|nr:formate dehydrogenase subunit gamma [Burkholderiaceae bacterium]